MLKVLACGAIVFPGLFFAFRRILPCVFKHWSDADVVLVSERLVSTIHAIMATTSGVIVVSSCQSNVIDSRHWLVTSFVIWYGVPYMTYDLFAMYLSHYHRFRVEGYEDYQRHSLRTINSFIRREFLLVLHHIALLTTLLPVTLFFRKDQGDFFIGCLFLTELSTPFVSLGKILIQLGFQNCWLHKANGCMGTDAKGEKNIVHVNTATQEKGKQDQEESHLLIKPHLPLTAMTKSSSEAPGAPHSPALVATATKVAPVISMMPAKCWLLLKHRIHLVSLTKHISQNVSHFVMKLFLL
uniref:TLC domain-containing protein n=1 Tax=Monopterus albus TaxID=43700 RepID=A0A3Q3JM80_MONAL